MAYLTQRELQWAANQFGAGVRTTEDVEKAYAAREGIKALAPDLAECGVCGRNKRVCCDDGYTDNEDGTVTHVGAVCVDCCGGHRGAKWDGKSVAGGTYERCE